MTKLRATLIYMLKEKEPQINKTKHRLLRGILMETLKEIKEQAMNKLEDLIHEIGRMPIAYRGKDERVERVLMYYCTSSLLALVQDAAEEPSTYCFSVYPGNKT